jgi:S-DNA-T family DNA segregation ATPase FtsK/SpoIIIE
MGQGIKRIGEEIAGVGLVLLSIYLFISLMSYTKWDPSFLTTGGDAVKNYGGVVGAYISDTLLTLIGYTAYLIPLALVLYGLKRLLGKDRRRILLFGFLVLVISLPILLSLLEKTFFQGRSFNMGGFWGNEVSAILIRYLSLPGAYILGIGFFLSAVIMISPDPITETFGKIFSRPSLPGEPSGVKVLDGETGKRKKKREVFLDPEPSHHHAPVEEVQPSRPGEPRKYRLPRIEFLSLHERVDKPLKEELVEQAGILEAKLRDFNITGKVTQVHPGPIVTMYEFEPSPGIKISKIVSLADDLGRAMGGVSVRIAPIPGKTPLGIEIPNRRRGVVALREIIDSESFRKSHSRLTIAIGMDIYGRAIVSDLTRMPHLLVAGTTGSGKSVAINSMIMSILYKARPEEVKMLMIDPKLLELSAYDGIPHLISPVVTNPKDATTALKKMVLEMERRYRLIAEEGRRNIENFNLRVSDEEKLPYIVVIIDELADLMFTASKEVEDSIVRLAQMARASGIHLIVATQRPSVDVITGIIKANFPTRMAFQVSTKVDSRTILDTHGAEQLIGRGDMLLMAPGARLMRIHGAYVSEDEIRNVTNFIKSQAAPDYSFFDSIEMESQSSETGGSEDRDELYQKVIEFGKSKGEVSISSIQRRFKIGYNRAARLMQLLEEDGLVGPHRGAGKPRDFLRR